MQIASSQNTSFPNQLPMGRTHDKAEYMHMHIPSHIIMLFRFLRNTAVMRSAPLSLE